MNKNEQGRSLVEMLGVLAIIGVLTLMGISGYQAALSRHRANEVLNVARLILQEQGAAKATGEKVTKSTVGMGKLPGSCWICSYKENEDQLLIGGCEKEVMKNIGSILGKHWKLNETKNCGKVDMQKESSSPSTIVINGCKNNADNLVYSND